MQLDRPTERLKDQSHCQHAHSLPALKVSEHLILVYLILFLYLISESSLLPLSLSLTLSISVILINYANCPRAFRVWVAFGIITSDMALGSKSESEFFPYN